MISFFVLMILPSCPSYCSGRFLDDHQPCPGHVDYSGSLPPSYFDSADHHDRGDFENYLINSTARFLSFERRNLEQEDEGTAIVVPNVDDFGAKGNGKDDTEVRN